MTKTIKEACKIDFGWSNIADIGIKRIAEELKSSKSLTQIALGFNNITNIGASDIAEVLKVNQSLTQIDLGSNNIADTGACEIAEALKINQILTQLNLWNNNITDIGAMKIAEALNDNFTLTEIDLDNNEISSELKNQINASLDRNKKLKEIFPPDDREQTTWDIAYKILPNSIPTTIIDIIAEYDSTSMTKRIADKIDPQHPQTLEDILKASNLETDINPPNAKRAKLSHSSDSTTESENISEEMRRKSSPKVVPSPSPRATSSRILQKHNSAIEPSLE